MRKWIVFLAALVIVGCASMETGILPEAKAASFSWRFAGLNALKGNTNLVTLREVTGLPEFEGFRSNLAERVALTLATNAGGAGNEAMLKSLREVTGDLIAYETVFEKESSNDCSLAILLPMERHEVWKKNWETLAAKVQNAKLSREGGWTFVSNGSSKKALDRARDPIKDVFELSGDVGVLQQWWLPEGNKGKVDLKVRPSGSRLTTEGKMQFEKNLNLDLKAWDVPVNTVRGPIGFTAIQGVKERLSKWDAIKKHGAPNQLFIWGEDMNYWTVNAAIKVDDPMGFIKDFGEEFFKTKEGKMMKVGKLEFNTNSHMLSWVGLPIAIPYLKAAHTNDGKFVMGGLFPMNDFPGERMPTGLAEQLKPNVAYYDWEVTGTRIGQWRPIMQIKSMAQGFEPANYSTPAHAWLLAAQKLLKTATTEVTESGPKELALKRQSDLGFSSLELFNIVGWVSGPSSEGTTWLPGIPAPGAPKP